MMRWTWIIAVLLVSLWVTQGWSAAGDLILTNARTQVYFSPGAGATEAIVKEISAAKTEVLMQAYTLSSQPIVNALLDAHQRRVAVRLILDKSERFEGLTPGIILANAGVPVLLDGKHALAHSNVVIVDRQTVIMGSFAFTKAAEEMNSENLLIIHSSQLAREYRDNWERHASHSEVQ
jgi:phosphatidylserine/phosphatidylglycerophosphate/cardiolipin synthase-like enzyme